MSFISDRYAELGGPMGLLGEEATPETNCSDGIGKFKQFQHGSIFWSPSTGAHEVTGLIRHRWAELRWERGILGYPVAAPFEETRDRVGYVVATFQHGKISLNTSNDFIYVEKFSSATQPNYSIPICAYQAMDNDGGRPCSITAAGVRQWVNEANKIYAAAGVNFTYDDLLNELRDTEVNSLPPDNADQLPNWQQVRSRLNTLAAQTHKLVIVFRFGPDMIPGGGGFSYGPADNFVVMSQFDPVSVNALSVFAHELGHRFGLPHTHSKIFKTKMEAEDYILNGGDIAVLDNDKPTINDTLPDPYIEELHAAVTVHSLSLGGVPFLLSRKNIMSYWNHGGNAKLSHDQIDRVRQIIQQQIGAAINISVISPVNCSALLRQINSLRSRLTELRSDLASEDDPRARRRIGAGIRSLSNQLTNLVARARSQGCHVN